MKLANRNCSRLLAWSLKLTSILAHQKWSIRSWNWVKRSCAKQNKIYSKHPSYQNEQTNFIRTDRITQNPKPRMDSNRRITSQSNRIGELNWYLESWRSELGGDEEDWARTCGDRSRESIYDGSFRAFAGKLSPAHMLSWTWTEKTTSPGLWNPRWRIREIS